MKKIFTIFLALVCAANIIYAQQLSPVGNGIQGIYINDISVYKGELYAGGYFTPASVAAQHVYKFDGTSWKTMSGGISGGAFPFIKSFCTHNNKLYMTGAFTKTGTTATLDFGIWNGATWEDPKGGLNNAWALVEYNNTLYAGTNTYQTNGGKAAFLWRWNETTGWVNISDSFTYEPSSQNYGLQGINQMMVYNNKLVVAGNFSHINGLEVNNIAMWDGTNWEKLGQGTSNDVSALTMYYGKLYAGGWFDSVGNETAGRLAVWDGTKWSGFTTGIDYQVTALHVYDDDLYIGGSFFKPARGLIKYDGANFTTPFTINGSVSKLLSFKNDLYIAGDFDTINNQRFSLIAKYHIDGVGVQEVSKNTVQVYPNPVSDNLTINHPSITNGLAQICIYDNLGRELLNTPIDIQGTLQLPVQKFAAGSYYISVKQGHSYYTGHFIKQ